jgi:predicted DsbA family dithiol-disulfide isomerase
MTLRPVLHWFDFICPLCYVAQDRNQILRVAGVAVIDLPMQIHPQIGPGGAPAPPRIGPMYERLAVAAREAGFELTWSRRIPYSRHALVAAEIVRITQPESHRAFIAGIFHAYFALGKDIENMTVIAECAEDEGIDPSALNDDTTVAVAENELHCSESRAREHHVAATPSWLVNPDQLITGLRTRAFFTALGRALSSANNQADQASVGRSCR